jgi:acetyl-CoA acetyltransferase
VHNAPDYASAHFKTVAKNLWAMAKMGPADIDVVQAYENFTGGVLLSLVEHGFVKPESANEFLVPDNLKAGSGRMPLNTSGGNLAECYMHGLEMVNEAVRQLRGSACNQVADAKAVAVLGGPMVTPVSSLILGTEATL